MSYKTFFCTGCQRHKNISLYAGTFKKKKQCTTCMMPPEKRKEMGIPNPYENTAEQRASIKQAPKAYVKPISNQSLYAITGEKHGTTKTT